MFVCKVQVEEARLTLFSFQFQTVHQGNKSLPLALVNHVHQTPSVLPPMPTAALHVQLAHTQMDWMKFPHPMTAVRYWNDFLCTRYFETPLPTNLQLGSPVFMFFFQLLTAHREITSQTQVLVKSVKRIHTILEPMLTTVLHVQLVCLRKGRLARQTSVSVVRIYVLPHKNMADNTRLFLLSQTTISLFSVD